LLNLKKEYNNGNIKKISFRRAFNAQIAINGQPYH